MPTAVLFPGQGAQAVGMGRDVFDNSRAGRAVFELADKVLGFPLTEIIFSGPEDRLTETQISQPAILVTSIAVAEAAREAGWKAAVATAGLSLGEYSALVFAGAIALEDAIALVHKRGTYMREAGRAHPGGMLSIIGLDENAVADVLKESSSSGVICAANLLCPGQTVVSGELPALEAAEKLAAARGAMKTISLKVDGAFHSPLMADAARRLAADLARVTIRRPALPFLANVTGDFVDDPERIRSLLAAQVTSSVLWEKSMRAVISMPVSSAVELGPGRVLAGLAKRIERKFPCESVNGFDQAVKLGTGAA